MSIDISEAELILDYPDDALSELRTTQSDYENFFGDLFDQLQSLSLELFARHKCLELNARTQADEAATGEDQHRALRECMEGLRQMQAEVRLAHEQTRQVWDQISTAQQQFLSQHAELRGAQEELRQIAVEFRGLKEDRDQDRLELRQGQEAIQEHLRRLAGVAAELAEARTTGPQTDEIAEVLAAARQQQAAWQQERAGLESELEAQRCRAAQQGEALAEQRRLAAQHEAELAGELKRMRSLLEAITSHMTPEHSASTDSTGTRPPATDNAVLGSVLAQFEMLQRDIAQRRAGGRKPAGRP